MADCNVTCAKGWLRLCVRDCAMCACAPVCEAVAVYVHGCLGGAVCQHPRLRVRPWLGGCDDAMCVSTVCVRDCSKVQMKGPVYRGGKGEDSAG